MARGRRPTPAAAARSRPAAGGGSRVGAAPDSARPPIGRRGATPLYRETRLAARGGPCPGAGFVRRAASRSFNNGRRERPGAGPVLKQGRWAADGPRHELCRSAAHACRAGALRAAVPGKNPRGPGRPGREDSVARRGEARSGWPAFCSSLWGRGWRTVPQKPPSLRGWSVPGCPRGPGGVLAVSGSIASALAARFEPRTRGARAGAGPPHLELLELAPSRSSSSGRLQTKLAPRHCVDWREAWGRVR